jgi:hypothetical protein
MQIRGKSHELVSGWMERLSVRLRCTDLADELDLLVELGMGQLPTRLGDRPVGGRQCAEGLAIRHVHLPLRLFIKDHTTNLRPLENGQILLLTTPPWDG